jgi:small subunit ribosomal protein S19e
MATIYDIEPMKLIEALAKEFESKKELAMPEWARFVKTGVHVERPPTQENWWHIRSAALLRTIYKDGPVGVSKLRTKYGGSKNRGLKPNRFRRSSGKIIRTILQQLETLELVKKAEKGKGRIIAPKGQALLDNTANQLIGKSKKVAPKTDKKAPIKEATVKEAPKPEKKVEVKKE